MPVTAMRAPLLLIVIATLATAAPTSAQTYATLADSGWATPEQVPEPAQCK